MANGEDAGGATSAGEMGTVIRRIPPRFAIIICSATLGRHELAQTVAALRKIRSVLNEG